MTRMAQVSPRRVLAATAAILILGVAVGCTGDPTTSPSSEATGPTGPTGPAPASVVTTPVPPPEPGNTSATVATRTIDKRKPVALDKTSRAEEGIDVMLTAVKAITADAQGPGEVSGPALAITVSVSNSTTSEVSLLNAAVTLTASDGSPGSPMTAAPATQLPTTVGAGQTVTAVFVFAVAKGKRDPVTIEVSADPKMPTAVFRGKP